MSQGELPLMFRHFGNVDTMQEHRRLDGILDRVKKYLSDGQWRTLGEISGAVGCSEATASARLRDLRKVGFGNHQVDRRQRSPKSPHLYEYRWIQREQTNATGL